MTKRKTTAADEPVEDLPFDDEIEATDEQIAELETATVLPIEPEPVPEETMRVSIALPRSALAYLLDPHSPMSDYKEAVKFGLIADDEVHTWLGQLVRYGFDETALRHKMNTALRIAANAKVDKGV